MQLSSLEKTKDLARDVTYYQDKLQEASDQLKANTAHNHELVKAVADTFLVDDQGQPVDGLVYWYNGVAVVRLVELRFIGVIPVQTLDRKTIEAKINGEAEAIKEE